MWYGRFADNDPGAGNLALDCNLTYLDAVSSAHPHIRGVWDVGDGMCGEAKWCLPSAAAAAAAAADGSDPDPEPCGSVWYEPYCGGGAVGPARNYTGGPPATHGRWIAVQTPLAIFCMQDSADGESLIT
jgi:hypothetical protein